MRKTTTKSRKSRVSSPKQEDKPLEEKTEEKPLPLPDAKKAQKHLMNKFKKKGGA